LVERAADRRRHFVAIVHPDGGAKVGRQLVDRVALERGDRRGGGAHRAERGEQRGQDGLAAVAHVWGPHGEDATASASWRSNALSLSEDFHVVSRALQHQRRAGRLFVEIAFADVDGRLERDRARLVAVGDGDDVVGDVVDHLDCGRGVLAVGPV
jgi:hypothetical protein